MPAAVSPFAHRFLMEENGALVYKKPARPSLTSSIARTPRTRTSKELPEYAKKLRATDIRVQRAHARRPKHITTALAAFMNQRVDHFGKIKDIHREINDARDDLESYCVCSECVAKRTAAPDTLRRLGDKLEYTHRMCVQAPMPPGHETLTAALAALCACPNVLGVEVASKALTVLTDVLYAHERRRSSWIELGCFAIAFERDNGYMEVTCKSLASTSCKYATPYGSRNETPCFGDFEEHINDAADEGNFVSAVSLTIASLTHINYGDSLHDFHYVLPDATE